MFQVPCFGDVAPCAVNIGPRSDGRGEISREREEEESGGKRDHGSRRDYTPETRSIPERWLVLDKAGAACAYVRVPGS